MNYMNLTLNFLKAGFLLSIVMVSFIFAQNSALINHPLVASAVTFDLAVTLPFAYWFFIRKTRISKRTVVPFVIFGIVLASFILPENNRQLLDYLTSFALPIIELGVLAYVGFVIYKSRKTYKSLAGSHRDFLENLRAALTKEFSNGILAKAVTFETAGIYYAVFKWKAKRGEGFFTYHRKNGVAALLIILGFIVAAETVVLHILVAKWSVIIAWILTVFSVYFLFQIYAHAKAVFLRPIEIAGESLFIRCGLLGDAEIKLAEVASVEITMPPPVLEANEIKLAPAGDFTVCNLKLSLSSEAKLNGLYGRGTNFKALFLSIDEPEIFKAEIEKLVKK